jgi:chondroitin AC lyase
MKLVARYFSLFLVLWLYTMPVFSQSDFDTIKKRIVAELMKPRVDDARISELVKTMRDDGTWPGINYEDVSNTGFEHRVHSANMVLMARAYKTKSSRWYRKKELKAAVEKALSYWVTNDFICENWWHNQIGTPDNLVTLMLIMGDELPAALVEKAQPIIGRAHLNASGARPSGDRIKIGGILAKNLLFMGDKAGFDEVIRVIEGEIKFTTGERGMQHDYSFHHREDRVNNTLSYGVGYADAFAEWAAYVAGTGYAFSADKINHLIDYYLDGICKQLVYGKINDPGTKNRDISRPGSFNPYGTATPERLLIASDYRRPELQEIIQIRRGEAEHSLSFGKYFWQTEHYSHQRPGYFTSVRMYSTRNRNMEEPYNSEGLKNHHRADGTNYLSVSGKEYNNMAPVYDWQKIPGATIMQKEELPAANQIQKDGLTDFVGAVSDGMYGAVAFDFKSPHDPLVAKKAWFFFYREYVCLGSGIASRGTLSVVTALNQCLLDGDVTVMAPGGKRKVERGEHTLENVQWVHHDHTGYIFPEPVGASLLNNSQTGSWYSINRQTSSSREEISMDVFKLWLNHGSRLQNGAYAYVVVPGISADEMDSYNSNPATVILSNTPSVQAVGHPNLGIYQMVFYTSSSVNLPDGTRVESDMPGLVMIKTDGPAVKSISVADPTRKMGKMHLTISGKVEFESQGATFVYNQNKNHTSISIALPESVFAGSAVTVK